MEKKLGINQKRIKQKILVSALLSLFFAHQVNATVIKQNAEDGIVINGNVAQNNSNEVIVSILGPFDAKTEYKEAIKDREKLYINSVYADKTGTYSFNYKPQKNNQFYAISVTNGGVQETAEIYFADADLISALLADINNMTDISDVFSKTEYEDVLINNYPKFKDLTSSQKVCIYKDISKNKKSGYINFDEFEKIYLKAIAVQSMNNVVEASDIMNLQTDFLQIDSVTLYNEYVNFSDSEKLNVFKRMLKRDISGIEDFYKIVNESIFLEKIENEEYSSNLTSFITNNAEELNIDISKYSSSANQINSKINKKYYKTLEDFKIAFSAAHTSNSNNTSGSSSGSSGGNSNSGSSNKFPNSIYVKPDTTENNNVLQFDDLDTVSWARDAILALAEKNIVSGKADGEFCPQDLITREEFVKMVVGAFEITAETKVCQFEDVEKGAWFYNAVVTAANSGIVSGVSETNFGVGKNITRQDIAAILYRIGNRKGFEFSKNDIPFADDYKIAEYAKDAVYSLKLAGVISGFEDNTFGAEKNATRAEAAKMIYLMMEVLS